jgi:hypothetical protein
VAQSEMSCPFDILMLFIPALPGGQALPAHIACPIIESIARHHCWVIQPLPVLPELPNTMKANA